MIVDPLHARNPRLAARPASHPNPCENSAQTVLGENVLGYTTPRKGILCNLASLGLLLGVIDGNAAEGDIDTAFGHGGITLLEPANANVALSRPLVQDDGTILICRSGLVNYSPARSAGFVYRLTRDGLPDAGFGDAGRVEFDTGDVNRPCGLALQHDGRIVVHTSATADPAAPIPARVTRLFRLNTDGSRDPTFAGGAAQADLLVDGTATASAIAIQPDDAIVLGVALEKNRFGIARFGKDGAADGSFGANGFATIEFPRVLLSFNSVSNVLIDSQRRILVTGAIATDPVGRELFAAARFLQNGTPDPSFANGGQATIDLPGRSGSARVGFLQSGDRLVLAGMAATNWSPNPGPSRSDVGAARLLDDGSPDPAFGIGGTSIVPVQLAENAFAMAFSGLAKPDGGAVLVGRATDTDGKVQGLMLELDERGHPRSSPGANGVRLFDDVPDGGAERVFVGVARQQSNYIVVGVTVRYTPGVSTNFVMRVEGVPANSHSLRVPPPILRHPRSRRERVRPLP